MDFGYPSFNRRESWAGEARLADPRKLWSAPGNPPRSVSDSLGVERGKFHAALSKLKAKAGYGPADDVTIWSDGSVTDWRGEWLGDIHGEI